METLDTLIQTHNISAAVSSIRNRTPSSIFALIDLDSMHDKPEPYAEFCRAYYHAACTLDRVEIADWFLSYSTTAFSYLDVEAESAHLLTSAIADAIRHLADKLDGTVEVAYGPDAGLTRAQSAHYQSIAVTLREIEIPVAAITRAG